jgi:hypothetical protein
MATAPEARIGLVTYPGGSASAPQANLRLLFPEATLRWKVPTGRTANGRRKRARSRQRSNAAAGEVLQVVFTNGEIWSYRVTGAHIDFIKAVLERDGGAQVLNIWSERGTEYGPEPDDDIFDNE